MDDVPTVKTIFFLKQLNTSLLPTSYQFGNRDKLLLN